MKHGDLLYTPCSTLLYSNKGQLWVKCSYWRNKGRIDSEGLSWETVALHTEPARPLCFASSACRLYLCGWWLFWDPGWSMGGTMSSIHGFLATTLSRDSGLPWCLLKWVYFIAVGCCLMAAQSVAKWQRDQVCTASKAFGHKSQRPCIMIANQMHVPYPHVLIPAHTENLSFPPPTVV